MNKKPDKELIKFITHYGALQPDSRFAYVAIHALEGEPSLLKGKPKVVDCYWVIGNAGVFVSTLRDPNRASFVSYTPRRNAEISHAFFVVTKSNLNSATMERILEKLAVWLDNNRPNLPDATTIIADSDFGSAHHD